MSLSAVFFDLDGTLLPMDQDVFTKQYFRLLARRMASVGYEPDALMSAVWRGTAAMLKNNGEKTNEEAFWETFAPFFPDRDVMADIPQFDDFYRTDFHKVREVCGFQPMAAEIIRILRERGLRVILATNPLFPEPAVHARLSWAGLKAEDFEYFTTYQTSSFCKPDPRYYLEILDRLSLKPEECLMVGNDVTDDMAAEKTGMSVFLLTDCLINKEERSLAPFEKGGFDALLAYIERTA